MILQKKFLILFLILCISSSFVNFEQPAQATLATCGAGCAETFDGAYTIHTFTSSGTWTVTSAGDVEYLVVAGGGGGSGYGGGGGGGGYKTATGHAVTVQSYSITIGAGGIGSASKATDGSNSVFDTVTSTGGGAGGSGNGGGLNGNSGGSGGGGGQDNSSAGTGGAGTGSEGFAGGTATAGASAGSGGGGGASEVGDNYVTTGGDGGDGLANSISGSSVYYAGGGGGSKRTSGSAGSGGLGGGGAGAVASATGTAGTANTGGAGGGSGVSGTGGDGGSGIVILRFLSAPAIPIPDSITDLSLDSSTQTSATVSFTPPNLNGGNLTTYSLYLDTPQTNNVITFNQNFTDNPLTITGLTLGTSYSANATAITEGGANFTAVNILNFTTATFNPPGTPTLSASALSDTAIRFTSVPGTAGDNSTAWYGVQCELNGAGGWLNTVSNSSYVSFYEYTGLTLGDVLICQWRDGSADGWSGWSNNATDTLELAVLSAQRTIADTDDKLIQFINMVSGMGGVYFGLGALPFGVMLLGFMAGKKTVRIFTLATLFLMGIIHASGYYVYADWYWTLALLFGIVLVMGRMKSD